MLNYVSFVHTKLDELGYMAAQSDAHYESWREHVRYRVLYSARRIDPTT